MLCPSVGEFDPFIVAGGPGVPVPVPISQDGPCPPFRGQNARYRLVGTGFRRAHAFAEKMRPVRSLHPAPRPPRWWRGAVRYTYQRRWSADLSRQYMYQCRWSADLSRRYMYQRRWSADSSCKYMYQHRWSADLSRKYMYQRRWSTDLSREYMYQRRWSADLSRGYMYQRRWSADLSHRYMFLHRWSTDLSRGYMYQCRWSVYRSAWPPAVQASYIFAPASAERKAEWPTGLLGHWPGCPGRSAGGAGRCPVPLPGGLGLLAVGRIWAWVAWAAGGRPTSMVW